MAVVVQVRCVAEAVYRQDAIQLQDLIGFTRIRDQGAPTRKVKVHVECGPPRSMGEGCYEISSADEALGVCLVVDTGLAFTAMCLSAACGHYEMVEVIGNAGKKRMKLSCCCDSRSYCVVLTDADKEPTVRRCLKWRCRMLTAVIPDVKISAVRLFAI